MTTTNTQGAADLIAALKEAQSAINSMKVEAETAAQGDEQMMLEACETISNEGLQADMAIRAALAFAAAQSKQETEATHLRELAAPSTDQVEEILRERDDADDFIDALLDEVLGPERPEWSSAYGRADALNDVRERMTALHKPAVDKAWDRFQSAMEAPQQPAPSPVPAGWKLVPVEPTEEMLKAADDGDDAYTLRCFGPGVQRVMQGPYDHYCAMLDAAPTAQADTQPAQQGVSYAALPESFLEIPDVQDESGINAYYSREVVLECIDAALASHGQAPAPTHEQIAAYLESTGAYVTNDATREAAIAEAIDTDRAKRGQAPDLHPKTSDLVQRFAAALAEKLAAAEKKYGYSDGWASPNWMDECRQHLNAHIAKGDPRDVAAYCAFLWHHGATTASPQAEQQAPTGSEIYVCARECSNCGHAGINDDHADNAACKSCDWSGPSPEKDHCPDCEKDGTMTAACPMCGCAYIMVADTQVAAPAAPPTPQAADSVQEDAARLDWLLLRISGAEFRRLGVHYSGNARRADVDAARKQGETK